MEIELKDAGSLDIQRKRERPNSSPLMFTLLKGSQENKQLVKGPVINLWGERLEKVMALNTKNNNTSQSGNSVQYDCSSNALRIRKCWQLK